MNRKKVLRDTEAFHDHHHQHLQQGDEEFMAVLDKPSVLTNTTKKRDSQVRYLNEEIEGLHSADGLRVSEAEYWETYYHDPDVQYEWNDGILEEKPMADYQSSEVYRWFVLLLEEYLNAFPVATPVYLEIGFRLALPHKTAIRKPDLALILHSNPRAITGEDCTYHGIFDLCIEFLSDSTPQEARRDTVVKKQEYCQAGVTEYFILDRKGKETAFYRLTETGTYAPISSPDGIFRSEVLPGFQLRLQDLYDHPDLRERLDDSVYNSFILLDYQAEHQRAEAERQRAEAERQRAERLATMLRELGIDPETGKPDK
jgi:Uma2 family endonuclease